MILQNNLQNFYDIVIILNDAQVFYDHTIEHNRSKIRPLLFVERIIL